MLSQSQISPMTSSASLKHSKSETLPETHHHQQQQHSSSMPVTTTSISITTVAITTQTAVIKEASSETFKSAENVLAAAENSSRSESTAIDIPKFDSPTHMNEINEASPSSTNSHDTQQQTPTLKRPTTAPPTLQNATRQQSSDSTSGVPIPVRTVSATSSSSSRRKISNATNGGSPLLLRQNTAPSTDINSQSQDIALRTRRYTISTSNGKGDLDTQGKANPNAVVSPSTSNSKLSPDDKKRIFSKPKTNINRMKGTREIDKNHSKFLLMYNMLSGIRITVSRCESRPDKDLTPDDYTAAHKIASDVAGTELEPKDNYDFKFKDYSPMVFRKIRQCFGLSSTDYLNSLTGKYVLSELDSPGKSGSFFYFSHDYRFIIKTIHTSEHNLLRKILPHYLLHITQNPHTLLARFYGLHRVKAPGKAPVHFVVMTNVFPSNKDIHEIYDLKGSSVGRFISEEEAKGNPKAVLKDINWMNRQRKLELGPEKRKAIIEQLEKDVEFLKKSGIMDYSLLVGIHDLKRGNMEGLRDTMLSVFEPNQDTLSRTAAQAQGMQGDKRMSRVMAVKAAIKESHPIALGPSSSKLPEVVPEERKLSMFYAEDGGLRSTNEQNIPTDELYFIGIIDILTPYNAAKKVEHWWKSLSNDRKGISAVHPTLYGKRFLGFMKGIFKHIE